MPELFPYQVDGAAWLAARRRAYLADEMGLGKTPQAIVAADMAGAEHVCVVCPASVKANWEREIERWSLGMWSETTVLSYDAAVRRGLPRGIDTLILDEAHYLKSITAKRTKAILMSDEAAAAARVWALSGTPAPNHVGELYTFLRFFGVSGQTTYRKFLEAHVRFMETPYGLKVFGNRQDAMPDLKAKVDGVMLRRLKRDVLKDLPPVRWGDVLLAAGAENAARNDSSVANFINVSDTLPSEDEHIAALRRMVGEAKAPALAAYLADELTEGKEKIVVFAWHLPVMDILEAALRKFGVARIDGGTLTSKRQGIVDRFQTDPDCRVFIGQIIAAGTGITLTAASSLVFAEMSWTPGDNAQAAMRVHRIGQDQPVLIRTTTLRGSIDEAVNAVLARKTRALDQLYKGAPA